jgi:hypothetical protein
MTQGKGTVVPKAIFEDLSSEERDESNQINTRGPRFSYE